MHNTIRAVFVLVLLTAPSGPMAAQAAAETAAPAAPTAETLATLPAQERAELLSRLTDEQARALLSAYLKAGTAPPSGTRASAIERLEAQSTVFQENFTAALMAAPLLAQVPVLVLDRLTAGRSALHPVWVVVFLAVILGAGYGGERVFMRTLAAVRQRLATTGRDADFLDCFSRITGLLIVDLLGLGLFAVIALTAFLLAYQGHEPTRLLVLTVLSAIVLLRFVMIVSRAVFGIGDWPLRLVRVDDEVARLAHRHVVAAGAIGAFGFLACDLLRMYGLGDAPHRLMTLGVGTLFILALLVGIWRLRRGVAAAVPSPVDAPAAAAGAARALIGLWHLPVMAYLLAVYALAVFNGFSGTVSGTYAAVASILLVAALPLADRILCAIVDRVVGAADDAGRSSRQVIHRAMHILVGVIAVVALAAIWRADLFSLDDAGIGGAMARAALDIALTVFVGYLAWGLLKAVIMRHMPAAAEEGHGGDEGGAASTTRLGTVLPLFLRMAQISIVVIIAMVVLSALGVNIGPLLAGAGVVGIAVGFGAQTLVRDLVSGLFFLIDDAFRRGEYVDIGSVKGTVERINVRSLVLRHHLGPLHTVPYGEIHHLTNYSRDWMIMKLEFRVGYDTDVNQVKKIFKQIGRDMLEHPEMGPDFIEPFKSQGVKAMEDSAMIVRGKFMAKPGKQFSIRKEIYSRVQKAFREAGIQFAHRRVTVEFPPDAAIPAERKQEIAEAAGAASLLDEGDKKRKRG